MADADVLITQGSGTKIDTRTVGAGVDEHRQVVCIGDPSTASRVALVDSSGALLASLAAGTIVDIGSMPTVNVVGETAVGTSDFANPLKVGAKAVAHGSNPTAVSAGSRSELFTNRHGILFQIGGHPNIITRSVTIADANNAQTDVSIVGTVATGQKVCVTALSVMVDSAVTASGGVAVKIGFGATTIPAETTTGTAGILLNHPGIAAGSGVVLGNGGGILGIGADGEELRLTCEDPVGGALTVTVGYFTIES